MPDESNTSASEIVTLPLNKFSQAGLINNRRKTGLDVPGAIRFALVMAGSLLEYKNPNLIIFNAAYGLAMQDANNQVPREMIPSGRKSKRAPSI